MDTADVLKAALVAVDAAEVPDDLREVAFGKAIDLVAGPIAREPDTRREHPLVDTASAQPPTDRLERIANALNIPTDRIGMVYDEHEDMLQVVADPDHLGSSTKERAKSVALLVAAGRQLGGWDDGGTADAPIRREVDRLGVYDNTNYSKHMKDLSSWFNINGRGRNVTYKLKHAGRQHLKDLAERLVAA